MVQEEEDLGEVDTEVVADMNAADMIEEDMTEEDMAVEVEDIVVVVTEAEEVVAIHRKVSQAFLGLFMIR